MCVVTFLQKYNGFKNKIQNEEILYKKIILCKKIFIALWVMYFHEEYSLIICKSANIISKYRYLYFRFLRFLPLMYVFQCYIFD